jgi:hypothetical protein
MNKEPDMNRRQFLGLIGKGLTAAAAVSILPSCEKSDEEIAQEENETLAQMEAFEKAADKIHADGKDFLKPLDEEFKVREESVGEKEMADIFDALKNATRGNEDANLAAQTLLKSLPEPISKIVLHNNWGEKPYFSVNFSDSREKGILDMNLYMNNGTHVFYRVNYKDGKEYMLDIWGLRLGENCPTSIRFSAESRTDKYQSGDHEHEININTKDFSASDSRTKKKYERRSINVGTRYDIKESFGNEGYEVVDDYSGAFGQRYNGHIFKTDDEGSPNKEVPNRFSWEHQRDTFDRDRTPRADAKASNLSFRYRVGY